MLDSALQTAIRDFGAQRKYSVATIDRWLALTVADGAALLDVASELRLGENQLRDLWEWADDIAARDGLSLAQILTSDPVAAALRSQVSRNDRLKRVKDALRRLRCPQLTAIEERLAGLVRALALPQSVRLTFPEGLEGDAVRVEIVAESAAALRAAAARLHTAADTDVCAEIFTLLREAP